MKKGSTILVVEDEEIHRLALRKILEDRGYVVITVTNGAEGLEVLRTSTVDLAVVDLEMPVMNGVEFSRWVKDWNANFPVIIVTAHVGHFSPSDILSVNVDALLQKPIKVEELMKLLDQF